MMRYAADDRLEQAAAFSGGDYRVDVRVVKGVLATQVASAGASLKIDGQWVLNPNQAVALPLDGIQSSFSWSTTRPRACAHR